MHVYSVDTKERTYITIIVFVISVLFCILLQYIFNSVGFSIPTYFESPTPLVIYGILFYCVDNCLWKVKWIRIILRIKTPNLNGNWVGEYNSSYKDGMNPEKDFKGEVGMEIKQTLTRIQIVSDNHISHSCSLMAGIFTKDKSGVVLKFEFENKPNKTNIETMHMHSGFTELRYKENMNLLEGSYYTDKNRQTHGFLEYRRENKSIISV